MTTIKFLGYDLELVAGGMYPVDTSRDVVSICIKFNEYYRVFMSCALNSFLKTNLTDIYNLIASDIEDEMTDWVLSVC